jgi:hypothetical protein
MAAANKRWRREMLTYFCFTLLYAVWPIGMIYLNIGAVSRLTNATKWPELKIVFVGLASLAMLCGSFFYGLRYVRGATNSVVFLDLCVLVFIVSVVIATFCRFLPEDN